MVSSAHQGCWILEEAAMAAITVNAAHQKEQAQEQLKAALTAYREMLDTFVNNRVSPAAAEPEHVRSQQFRGAPSPSTNAQ
jgi:predicted RNA-binding Zn ribbon-like protein